MKPAFTNASCYSPTARLVSFIARGRITNGPNAPDYCHCPSHRQSYLELHKNLAKTRRLFVEGSAVLLSTLWGSNLGPAVAFAEEEESRSESAPEEDKQVAKEAIPEELKPNNCSDLPVTKSVFFDVAIDGEPAGRIVIGLYGKDVPIGASRFAELATGKRGVGYRKKEFVKITPSYIQNAGIRSFGVDAEISGGRSLLADELIGEAQVLEKRCEGIKTFGGAVCLIIKDPSKPPSQVKLVARQGKLEVKEEEVRPDPNGTEFLIVTKNAPELDPTTLVVGRVLSGMDVVDKIARVKVVQENTGSPYFQVAKLIGDKRAVVAERGFNRPYSKIVITKCGELK
eukprot:Gb_20584 [translate_table: standard]